MDRINAADVVKAFDHLAQLRAKEAILRSTTEYGIALYNTTAEITTALKTLENILVRVG